VQILRMADILLLDINVSHRNIMGNGRQERLCTPIYEELVQNESFKQPSPSSPLMNMIRYVGGRGLSERGQKFYTSLVPYRQLKMRQEIHGKRIKVGKGVTQQFNIPFLCHNYKCYLKKSKTNGIIHQRVGITP